MELIFFHAGDYKEKPDKDGKPVNVLTRKAGQSTAKATEGIYRLLPRKTKIEVWSNMTPHLTQTAEIIAKELGVKTKFVNAIGQADIQELLKIMAEHAKEKCVIIVGDNTFLNSWSAQLSGIHLPFKPFSAAAFVLNKKALSNIELLWFAADDSLLRIR